VSEPQKWASRPELRILFASLLSMLVILAWAKYFAPKPPTTSPEQNQTAATAPATPGQTAQQSAATSAPAAKSQQARPTPAAATTIPVKSDSQERTFVVENGLYRVEFSNRGGVVKSWQLKKYRDDAKPPRTLDVVHPEVCQYLGAWPFGLVLDDAQLETSANTGLYVTTSAGSPAAATVSAPASLSFTWSDGHLEITKRFQFDDSYVVKAEVDAKYDGKPIIAGLAWLGGFGDLTVTNPVPIETVNIIYTEGGKLTQLPHKKLENIDKWGQGVWQGGKDWTGIEDRYFAAVFLPPSGAAPGTLETRYWNAWHPIQVEGKEAPEAVPEIATAAQARPLELRVFVGPKDYDLLKKMSPPLQSLVNFGWWEIIAAPLFYALKWLHIYIPNWGWAIVALTVIMTVLLFPLRISSYKSMLKMQRVAPEVKAIQDRYKKYKMNDPRKQEMQKEVMAVYSREGINPVGGCIPQLLQLPIWFGLYRALQGTIELRHAPWFWWIKDLSAKDPYYVLPTLMGLTMYVSMKITPMPSTDPQQQMMMKVMPIGMAAMFFVIPYPSGLAVYIFTSYLLGTLQQWYLNRTHPPVVPAKATGAKPARGKKG
jgi:YidC/Oxa1 family membrane protein insertase